MSEKDIIHKGSINTQKVNNAPNLICQAEPPATKVVMVEDKMRTDASIFLGDSRYSNSSKKKSRKEQEYEINYNVASKKVSNSKPR